MEGKELPYNRFEEIYNNQINDSCYYCLICEQDNNVIGMLNLRFEVQLHHSERVAEVLEFAISSAYRSKGIGKEMFTQSCEIAKSNGCSQIEVACNQLRKDTHRFYLRESMHNFHFKFSKRLVGDDAQENALGK
jgi:PhnO protein